MTTRSLPYTHTGPPPGLPTESEVLGRAAQENFRVVSRVLPKDARDHLLAFYGYARLVDQIGDSYPGDRLAALDWVEAEVQGALERRGGSGAAPLVDAAARSVMALRLDPSPLYRLIDANRADQRTGTYDTFADLIDYCALSANPVGQLVLGAFGASTPEHIDLSNRICTGLQLAEHWQDVAEDASAGRIYLPQEDLRRFDVDPSELTAARSASPNLKALMVFEVARARRLLDDGRPLIAQLGGRFAWAVAGFWAGGQAALDAIAGQGFDPLRGAPRPTRLRLATHMLAALTGSRSRREAA